MSPNPSRLLRVMLVGTLPGVHPPTCDPAVDLSARPGALLSAYERTRSDADRAAIPLRPGASPSLFEVSPLTPAGYRYVRDAQGAMRDHRAFRLCCHAFTDEHGQRHEAAQHGGIVTTGTIAEASDDWLDHVAGLYGEAGIREVAKVALDRAEAGPRAVAPFGLPPGLMLPA